MRNIFICIALLFAAFAVSAQTVPSPVGSAPVPAPTGPVQNFYAAGPSYSINAQPAVAGTALYAHLLIDGTSTYAFTVIDATPNTISPFTVNTNIGLGVAQKITSLGKVTFWVPTSAGISWSGTNTGWQWNGGVMATIPVKNSFSICPTVRFLKSSVSGGSGYQPIIGVLVGWGK